MKARVLNLSKSCDRNFGIKQPDDQIEGKAHVTRLRKTKSKEQTSGVDREALSTNSR